jgi:excisionase family DNA binding protein
MTKKTQELPFITAEEAAGELGIGVCWLRGMIRAGRVKATRFGRRVLLIRPADLDAIRTRRSPGRPRKGVACGKA